MQYSDVLQVSLRDTSAGQDGRSESRRCPEPGLDLQVVVASPISLRIQIQTVNQVQERVVVLPTDNSRVGMWASNHDGGFEECPSFM